MKKQKNKYKNLKVKVILLKNNEIKNEIINELYNDYINDYVSVLIKENPSIINKYEILEIEYNMDGSKKDIYSLASERDIKKVQINADKNELDYKFSQKYIDENEYNNSIALINEKINNLDLLYDDLIFDIINKSNIDDITKSILKYNLNNIDLDRLARAISSVSENKIEEFRVNNKSFMVDKISYWNYKYNKISKGISKAREVESFIMKMIKDYKK